MAAHPHWNKLTAAADPEAALAEAYPRESWWLNKDRAAFRQAMVENLPRMARLSHRAVISAKDSKGKARVLGDES